MSATPRTRKSLISGECVAVCVLTDVARNDPTTDLSEKSPLSLTVGQLRNSAGLARFTAFGAGDRLCDEYNAIVAG
jgi:hypothetical protein